MMNPGECRVKALEALANAAKETTAKGRLDWEIMSQQWNELAARIEAEEVISGVLLRPPSGAANSR
jgi:hypothetical protein